MRPTESQLIAQAQSWRSRATEFRDAHRDEQTKTVPPAIEMAALTLEQCAVRLEKIVAEPERPNPS